MFDPTQRTKPAGEKSSWRYFPLGLAVVAVYLGFVFFTRWSENRAMDQAAREKAEAKEVEADRRAVEMMGGNRFAILAFYSFPGAIAQGDTSQLCYGVSNAKSVRIEPFPKAIRPFYSHCVKVSPRSTTTYTLTAEDAQGHSKTATTMVKVK